MSQTMSPVWGNARVGCPYDVVIIDVQQGMFSFRRPLYQGTEVLARIAGLLERARGAFDSPVLPAEKIIAHHNRTLADGFVDLVSASDVVLWG
jgi:hypothetical protein